MYVPRHRLQAVVESSPRKILEEVVGGRWPDQCHRQTSDNVQIELAAQFLQVVQDRWLGHISTETNLHLIKRGTRNQLLCIDCGQVAAPGKEYRHKCDETQKMTWQKKILEGGLDYINDGLGNRRSKKRVYIVALDFANVNSGRTQVAPTPKVDERQVQLKERLRPRALLSTPSERRANKKEKRRAQKDIARVDNLLQALSLHTDTFKEPLYEDIVAKSPEMESIDNNPHVSNDGPPAWSGIAFQLPIRPGASSSQFGVGGRKPPP